VVGFDDKASGFFWLVGQGGYGVQTAPALAQIAAMLIEGQALSGYVEDAGIDVATLSPERLNRISAQEQTQVLQSRNV
jgi:D-arginine dehydrogenase